MPCAEEKATLALAFNNGRNTHTFMLACNACRHASALCLYASIPVFLSFSLTWPVPARVFILFYSDWKIIWIVKWVAVAADDDRISTKTPPSQI